MTIIFPTTSPCTIRQASFTLSPALWGEREATQSSGEGDTAKFPTVN